MSHWNCNDCPVNQWFCSDIGLCFYKMSESSSPSKTPEDEGSKSWEDWQVSLQPYMYILVVSFYLTHLLVSDRYPVCLLLYCFFAWRTFLFEYTPFIFYMEESKSFICDVIKFQYFVVWYCGSLFWFFILLICM